MWKDIPGSWIVRLKIDRMTILPKLVYKLNANLIKIQAAFLFFFFFFEELKG